MINRNIYEISKSKYSTLRYKKIFEKAKEESNRITNLLSDYLSYTFPIHSARRSEDEQVDKRYSEELYDSTSCEAAEGMSQYIRSTITPVWDKWATIRPAIKPSFIGEELDEAYDTITETIFDFINQSNFQSEHGVAINNLVGAGTGVLKIREGTLENPFDFTFVPLSKISIKEGSSGLVEKVFYEHGDMTLETILNTWTGADESLFYQGNDENDYDWEKEYKILESCIYLGKYVNKETGIMEDVYHYLVTNEEFSTVFYDITMKYNPFIVCRWEKRDDKISFGHPVIAKILPNVKTLNDAVKTEILGGKKMINPPIMVNHPQGQDGEMQIKNGHMYFMPMGTTYFPLQITGNFQLSLIKSDEIKKSIKENFIDIEKVFATDRNTYKTAEEISRQHYEFTKRYSTAYGKIEKEYLTPILKACFEILKKFGMVNFSSDSQDQEIANQENIQINEMINNLEITYINPLKKVKDREKLNSLVEFVQVTTQLVGQDMAQLLLDRMKTIETVKELLDIDRKLVNSNDVIVQLVQAQQEIQTKMMQQQEMESQQNTEQQQQGAV